MVLLTLDFLGCNYMSLCISILIDLSNVETKGACEYFRKHTSNVLTGSCGKIAMASRYKSVLLYSRIADSGSLYHCTSYESFPKTVLTWNGYRP